MGGKGHHHPGRAPARPLVATPGCETGVGGGGEGGERGREGTTACVGAGVPASGDVGVRGAYVGGAKRDAGRWECLLLGCVSFFVAVFTTPALRGGSRTPDHGVAVLQ